MAICCAPVGCLQRLLHNYCIIMIIVIGGDTILWNVNFTVYLTQMLYAESMYNIYAGTVVVACLCKYI